MDCWIVALRGAEDALVEARAVLGSPSGWVDSLEAFLFETLRPSDAAERLARLLPTMQQGLSGAVALEVGDPTDARLRAAALACAAETGELLLDDNARLRLEHELVLVRPVAREHWTLPCPSAALAPRSADRHACRELVPTLPTRPLFVARQRELSALTSAIERGGPVVVKAIPGAGAARLIEEAAMRAQAPAFYLPGDIIAGGPSALDRALERCPPEAWVIADPVPVAHAETFAKAIERIVSKRTVIVRISDEFVLPLRAPPEGITVGPLREYDARALVRAMLEGEHDPKIDKVLARRGEFLPGRIVEAVRAAVQLGTVIREESGWALRARRALKVASRPKEPVAARIHDLPQSLREALRAVCALNDGRSTQTAHALLRGLFSGAPNDALDRLSRLALVHQSDERIRIDESVRRAVGRANPRALTLLECGAAAHGAQAERYLAVDRPRDAALAFAQAARAALDAGATAAALRFLVHASRDSDQPEIASTIRAALAAIGPAVTFEVVGARVRPSRARTFDPFALEAAAAQLESRDDADGASRLRALAELVRGNSQRAVQLTATSAAVDESSSKLQLTAALAQASSGDAPRAVRSTLLALAIARQRNDSVGEAAALSLLSSLYRALGRDDDARAIADAAKKLLPANAPG
jgi:tetratricopeptide (TPR) repeat protein